MTQAKVLTQEEVERVLRYLGKKSSLQNSFHASTQR